jgi:hypothetical protein
MWHTTCTHIFQGDFKLLVGGNQIGTLIPSLFFGHNLYFKYSNGSCKPTLNIYVSRASQWYKKIFNLISFDPWNTSFKIWDSIGIPTLKVGIHLGVCEFIPSHSRECKYDSQIAFLTRTFPCLCLDHRPKAKVVTTMFCIMRMRWIAHLLARPL